MHQDLELDGLVTVVSNDDARAQGLRSQGDAVDERESEGPLALDRVVERRGRQAEVELDGAVGRTGRLRGRLS